MSWTIHLHVWLLLLSAHATAAGCGHSTFTQPNAMFSLEVEPGETTDCTYYISVNSSTWLSMSFVHQFAIDDEMPDCKANYAEVQAGCENSSKTIGRFCSKTQTQPPQINTISACLRVKVAITRPSNVENSITVVYFSHNQARKEQAPRNAVCASPASVLPALSGQASSPGWPASYQRSFSKCKWVLRTQNTHVIQLIVIDMDLARPNRTHECLNHLHIIGVASRMDSPRHLSTKLCTSESPIVINTNYYKVRMVLARSSDAFPQARGFMIAYTSYRIPDSDGTEPWSEVVFGLTFIATVLLILAIVGILHCVDRKPKNQTK